MSSEMKKQNNVATILDVKIAMIKPTTEEVEDYIIVQRKTRDKKQAAPLTFNEYLTKKYCQDSQDSNVKIVADLSDREFSKDGTDKIVNLAGGDFSNTILKNTSFKGCDLTDAMFCDIDFNNVYFADSILKNVDFRGADLKDCKFAEHYKDYCSLGKEHEIKNIQFSTTASLGRRYADINSDNVRTTEQQKLIKAKRQELDHAYKELSWKESGWVAIGGKSGNEKYDRLYEESKLMTEKKIFPSKNYIMHESCKNIFSSENCIFDPAYVRGLTKEERNRDNIYVKLSREDVIQYLETRKNHNNLSLNDFAKNKFIPATLNPSQRKPNTQIIADCSSMIDHTIDLSGLDFTGANLQGAVFSGTILSKCKFVDANISRANFEGTELDKSAFHNVIADNANFLNSNLNQAIIENSQFTHAFMAYSNGTELSINNSNFDYINIKNGKWDQAHCFDSTFNHATLEGISLVAGNLQKINMQHAMLDKAVLTKIKCKETILQNITAKGIDLSEAELDNFTKLDGANLNNAILERINAVGVSFVKTNLDHVRAQNANLQDTILAEASVQFTNLDKAILNGVKAKGINTSYSVLTGVHAVKADFSSSIMRHIKAGQADFTEVNFTDSDLTKAELVNATLEKVIAERMKLTGVNLQETKLVDANFDQAKIDKNTNINSANMRNVRGNFIENGKEITLQHLSQRQEQLREKAQNTLGNVVEKLSIIRDLTQVVGVQPSMMIDALAYIPVINRIVPETNTQRIQSNLFKFQELGTKLLSDRLLIEERRELQKKQQEHMLNLIDEVAPFVERILPIINNKSLTNGSKDLLASYSVVPAFSAVGAALFTPAVTMPDMLEGVDQEFIRTLVPLGANLAAAALSHNSNQTVKDIYKDLQLLQTISANKSDHNEAMSNIVKNTMKIVDTDRMQQVITKDLVGFLEDPTNQEAIVTIAENGLDNKLTRFTSQELFTNTISLLANVSATTLAHTSQISQIYKDYIRLQDSSFEFVTNESLAVNESDRLIRHRAPIGSILTNSKMIINNMAPILGNALPQYISNNKDDILKFFNQSEIQNNVKSYGIDPKLVQNITKNLTPFIVDLLPIVTEFAQNCLQNTEEIAMLIEQIQELTNVSPAKQSQKLIELIDSCIAFQNNNPEIKEILYKKIPDLLIKHAEDLGPMIEQFLNQTDIGKKLKLKGTAIVHTLGDHSAELTAITASWQKGRYSALIQPIYRLLSDKKVLALCVQGVVNFTQWEFQKRFISNRVRKTTINKEMNQIIIDSLTNQSPSSDKKINLAGLFQEKAKQYNINSQSQYSPTLAYSLSNNDLRGLSFNEIDMKFDNFIIEGFNFKKTELKKCSFQGSILNTCSFKGVIFKDHVNFDGTTIDTQTLNTLLPAIIQYNKKHPEREITLENVIITGDTSKIDSSSASLCNVDLTKEKNVVINGEKIHEVNADQENIVENILPKMQEIGQKNISSYFNRLKQQLKNSGVMTLLRTITTDKLLPVQKVKKTKISLLKEASTRVNLR